jgi:SAM-dependent methyltransferase
MDPDRRDDEEAGAREAFEDAALYDWEYRRRRADVHFYRRLCARHLAGAGPGPVLDLACGTGRVLVPLLRDGHTVVGVDRSPAMLARAAWRANRLGPTRRRRALLVRADLRALPFRRDTFAFAFAAFHSVQHLVDARDLLRFFRGVRSCLRPDGELVFDVLPPDPAWLARDPNRRWARTVFRHPVTRERLVYTTNHTYDPGRRALHMRLYYQPVDERRRPRGPERLVRLCHRQLEPFEVEGLLARAGFAVSATFGGWDERPLDTDGDQHIYRARPVSRKFA